MKQQLLLKRFPDAQPTELLNKEYAQHFGMSLYFNALMHNVSNFRRIGTYNFRMHRHMS